VNGEDKYIVIAVCPKCNKITPHEMDEYYYFDEAERPVKVTHLKCLSCGYEREHEEYEEEDADEKVQECIAEGGGVCNDYECVEGGCPYWLGDGLCALQLGVEEELGKEVVDDEEA